MKVYGPIDSTDLEDEKVASFDEDVVLLESLVVDGVGDDLVVDLVLARAGDGDTALEWIVSLPSLPGERERRK
jgi:hypothetical protein